MTRRLFATVVLALAVLVPAVLVVAESVVWNGTLEANPDDADLAADIDNFIRETRVAVRERADAEHEWDDGGQTGRQRLGSARSWLQDAAPTVLQAADSDGSTALDNGRFWAETDAETAVDAAVECCVRLNVRDQSNVAGFGATKWVQVIGVPTNAIVLWDQATGDEDCDGNAVADECPCGFVEATEFRGILARGADTAASSADIPDSPGVSCTGGAAPAGCGAAGGTDNYNDTLTADEIPAHTHDTVLARGDNDHGNPALNTDAFDAVSDDDSADTTITSSSTGGGEAQYHPFRAVLFCRAR